MCIWRVRETYFIGHEVGGWLFFALSEYYLGIWGALRCFVLPLWQCEVILQNLFFCWILFIVSCSKHFRELLCACHFSSRCLCYPLARFWQWEHIFIGWVFLHLCRGELFASPQRDAQTSSLGCNSQSEPSQQEALAAPRENTKDPNELSEDGRRPLGPPEPPTSMRTDVSQRVSQQTFDHVIASSPPNKVSPPFRVGRKRSKGTSSWSFLHLLLKALSLHT